MSAKLSGLSTDTITQPISTIVCFWANPTLVRTSYVNVPLFLENVIGHACVFDASEGALSVLFSFLLHRSTHTGWYRVTFAVNGNGWMGLGGLLLGMSHQSIWSPIPKEKNSHENYPENYHEMQFWFPDMCQLPVFPFSRQFFGVFRIERGISVLKIFNFLSML